MNRELTVADKDLPTLTVALVLVRPDEEDAQPYWSLRLSDTSRPTAWQYRSLTQADAARLGAHLLLGRVEAARDALRGLLALSTDPNAVTGEFDTTAGRARCALSDLDALLPAPAEAASQEESWDSPRLLLLLKRKVYAGKCPEPGCNELGLNAFCGRHCPGQILPAEAAPAPEPGAPGHEFQPDMSDEYSFQPRHWYCRHCGESRAAHAPAPPEKEA